MDRSEKFKDVMLNVALCLVGIMIIAAVSYVGFLMGYKLATM